MVLQPLVWLQCCFPPVVVAILLRLVSFNGHKAFFVVQQISVIGKELRKTVRFGGPHGHSEPRDMMMMVEWMCMVLFILVTIFYLVKSNNNWKCDYALPPKLGFFFAPYSREAYI